MASTRTFGTDPKLDATKRLAIRPMNGRRATHASLKGSRVVITPVYSPWDLKHADGARKFYVLTDAPKLEVGALIGLKHVNGGAWRADWRVVNPATATGSYPVWAVVKPATDAKPKSDAAPKPAPPHRSGGLATPKETPAPATPAAPAAVTPPLAS